MWNRYKERMNTDLTRNNSQRDEKTKNAIAVLY